MFSQNNSSRNSYLIKSCDKLPRKVMQDSLKEIFFRHLESPALEKEKKLIDSFSEAEKNSCVGYGEVGFEDIILNLASCDPVLVEKSANLLRYELKVPSKIVIALKQNILETLTEQLNNFRNFVSPTLVPNLLLLLLILSSDFNASMSMTSNEILMKTILNFLGREVDKNISTSASKVVLSLSSTLSVADSLLYENDYFLPAIEQLVVEAEAGINILEAFANIISRQPKLFAKAKVFNALRHHLLNVGKESLALKCLGHIMSCKEGNILADSCELILVLSKIVLTGSNDEEVKTNSILALKNCMLSETSFFNPNVPWNDLARVFIQSAYTKKNVILQQCSLQALRVISDKASVKEFLLKICKTKIRNVSCLSTKSSELKVDLIDWLDYKSYKSNNESSYSKLFI